jgi:hypothetical protein
MVIAETCEPIQDRSENKIIEIGRKLKPLLDGKSSRIGGEEIIGQAEKQYHGGAPFEKGGIAKSSLTNPVILLIFSVSIVIRHYAYLVRGQGDP